MSCFLLSEKSLAILAAFIERVGVSGFDTTGISCPESLRCEMGEDITSDKKIFYRLYDLNKRAVCGRYKINFTECNLAPDYIRADISKIVKWNNVSGSFVVESWHYQIIKTLSCFIYQSDEDETRRDPLLQGLKDLYSTLSEFIICNNEEYIKSVWG